MRYVYTIPTTLFFFIAFSLALSAQGSSPCGPDTAPKDATPIGIDVPPGSYVPGELIVSFENALTDQELEDFKDALGDDYSGFVAEWSPSRKYARVSGLKFTTCSITELIGAGKPLVDVEGEGQEVDFNYIASTQGWVENETNECTIEPDTDIAEERNGGVYNYSPIDNCSGPNAVLPPTSKASVRVAIVDSGVKGAPGIGSLNNVAHEQTMVPRDCRGEACNPVRPDSEDLTENFHPHGYYIFKIIADWFRSEDLENQLTVHSYQVLDDNLTCTQFQVIKAIELASMEFGANLVNLSITFEPANCGDPKSGSYTQERTALNRVIGDAEAEGVIVLSAAGNSCRDLSVKPEFPAAETGLNNLVVVGATKCENNDRVEWSNYSSGHVDLLALGDEVKIRQGGCTYKLYGTSFATPVVTAKAAFHITAQTTYDYQGVLCKLRSQADAHEDAIYGTVNQSANPTSCITTAPEDPEVGIEALVADVLVQPNPFQNEFAFKLSGDLTEAAGQVMLLDFNGNLLLKRKFLGGGHKIDFGDLAPGIYLLRVVTDRGELVKRVIKR